MYVYIYIYIYKNVCFFTDPLRVLGFRVPLRAPISTYIVECRVSIFGILIMVWESIPPKPITVPGTFWESQGSARQTVLISTLLVL